MEGKAATVWRQGTEDDSYAVFLIFEESFADLNRRLGSTAPTSFSDPGKLAKLWEERRSLYEHLARTSERYWIAERDGRAIGFARAINRDGMRELTELFVVPGEQSGGVGRELLARTFGAHGARHRSIIATLDTKALALYLRSGVYPRFPIGYFHRKPEMMASDTNLDFVAVTDSSQSLAYLGDLDRIVLGHTRDEDHAWLLDDRQGYLYYRDGRDVGYGYVGQSSGPFALINSQDFSAVLAHAEGAAAAQGLDHFGLMVPMINQAAVDYLLARSYRMDSFIAFFMSDAPFGMLENYVLTSPPFFL